MLGFFYISIAELLFAIVMIVGVILYLLISYWWITLPIIIILLLLIVSQGKPGNLFNPKPDKGNTLSTPTRIFKLYTGNETRLNRVYIHKKLEPIENIDECLAHLVDQGMLKIEVKYDNTYYVLTKNGIIQRNNNRYK